MEVIDTKELLAGLSPGWAVTIGNFDGLHLGHRRIIETCTDEAMARSATA